MKKHLVIIFLLLSLFAVSQDMSVENLHQALLMAKDDTTKIQILRQLAFQYLNGKPDSSLILYRQGLALAREGKFSKLEVIMLSRISRALAQFPAKKDSALACIQQAMTMARKNRFLNEEAMCYFILTELYFFKWDQRDSAFLTAKEGIEFTEKNKLPEEQLNIKSRIAEYYFQSRKPDSALDVFLDGILICQKNKLPATETEVLRAAYYTLNGPYSIDTSRLLMDQAMTWAKKNKDKKYEGCFIWNEGHRKVAALKYSEAFGPLLRSIKIFEAAHADRELAEALNDIGEVYYNLGEFRHSLAYYSRSIWLKEKLKDSFLLVPYQRIGSAYAKLKMHDSAVYFAKKCYARAEHFQEGSQFKYLLDDIAEIYAEIGEDSLAMFYFRKSLPYFPPNGIDYEELNRTEIFAGIAKLFWKAGEFDSAFYYARMALPLAQKELSKDYEKVRLTGYLYDASKILAAYYKLKHRLDSAFVYREIEIAAKDSLYGQEKLKELQAIEFKEQLRDQQVKEESIRYRSKVNSYFFAGGIAAVLLIVLILYRNNRIKQNANLVLKAQKQEVESTLEQLKSTQAQLVQSEKMASLGELTAGIAHEIQNPLNFVNNFSDVNKELLIEMNDEIEKGNFSEARSIAKDVIDNEEKINHHGKRADAIVKGMLQHSRMSTGQKKPTDINALCDEYLRLAYHGLRAKDKSFNVQTKTEFDNSIGNINVVPQDIGRVILNLINNAFYAVDEKKKSYEPLSASGGYEPTVTVSTKRNNGKVEVAVADNGNGIPPKVLDKIFQPFFTTKPTGQGTGLGLSLSYDIVKAHGGELKVETEEGAGTTFIIALPNTNYN